MGSRPWFLDRGEDNVEQPAWAAALQELHDTDGLITVEGKDSITESHPFVEKTHLSVEQARAAFEYLEHTGLIEPEGEEGYVISREGFQTAHERELNQRQWDIDLTMAVLTSGLFLITVINLILSQNRGLLGVGATVAAGVLFIWVLLRLPKYK